MNIIRKGLYFLSVRRDTEVCINMKKLKKLKKKLHCNVRRQKGKIVMYSIVSTVKMADKISCRKGE